MPNTLTREDLQDEFKQLMVEIRQIGKIVQDHVRQELCTFFEKYSCSSPVLQDPNPLNKSHRVNGTGALPCEAAISRDEGIQPYRKDESSHVNAPNAFPFFPSRVSNCLRSPADLSDEHPFAVPQDYTSEADFANPVTAVAVKNSKMEDMTTSVIAFSDGGHCHAWDSLSNDEIAVGTTQSRSLQSMSLAMGSCHSAVSQAELLKAGSQSQLKKLGSKATLSNRGSQFMGAQSSWLPDYRVSLFSEDGARRRRSSDSSEFSVQFSTVSKIFNGTLSWREALGMFFRGENFDYFMGLFLMMNAISIGVQVNYMADQTDQTSPLEWRLMDGCFCIVFTIELLIRIALYRGEYLRMKGWQWNLFDLCVVGFSVIDELTKLLFADGSRVRDTIDELFVLRMFRLARVVRLIRMVRLIPELKSMVYLIAASMWSFFWTVVLLMILIYVVAVYYTEMATDIKLELSEDERINDLTEHYGSIGRSMFSLFQAITGGDDWRNFVIVFKGQNYLLNQVVFSTYIAFATLVMLNLVTGVFVEGAQRIIREDHEAELAKNVRKLFHSTDRDHSGELNLDEFSNLVEHRTMRESLAACELNAEQAKALFILLDVDKSGELSVEEFMEGCVKMREPARSIDLSMLKYDFEEITQLWAGQFAELDVNIHSIMDVTAQLAHSMATTLPIELYDV